jgi:hypothetical protein
MNIEYGNGSKVLTKPSGIGGQVDIFERNYSNDVVGHRFKFVTDTDALYVD